MAKNPNTKRLNQSLKQINKRVVNVLNLLKKIGSIKVCVGKSVFQAECNSLIFFPYQPNVLGCGISALVAYKGDTGNEDGDLGALFSIAEKLSRHRLENFLAGGDDNTAYLGGIGLLSEGVTLSRALKNESYFERLFRDNEKQASLEELISFLGQIIVDDEALFREKGAGLPASVVEIVSSGLELLKDMHWCLDKEVRCNIDMIRELCPRWDSGSRPENIRLFKRINAVLNSLNRLEVRGRDSAGISVLMSMSKIEFEDFRAAMIKDGLSETLKLRTNHKVLANNSITIHDEIIADTHMVTLSIVYKFAAEIGALGDNVSFLRSQIRNDHMLQLAAGFSIEAFSVSAHTRWASVGDISEANCHPVDNTPTDNNVENSGIIHVCLNGDIDNYLELKIEYEARYDKIHPSINTDTKMIPLQIEHHLRQGVDIEESFRLAVNEFSGSHAISMHTDLAPGRLFLAQKGSGQALFVGVAPDHYIAASELYGVVEETSDFIKLNGEDRGQIVILDQDAQNGIEGIRSFYYDGNSIKLTGEHLQSSQITSRDIDRQGFDHYFLKEISESPLSVERTLENRISKDPETGLLATRLDRRVIPDNLEKDLYDGLIKKIYFIGQGTAGIAAQGCADLLAAYLDKTDIQIKALKSSELSGFCMVEKDSCNTGMSDTLVVAISQSGTTTDTNRTVDMIKACGARTLAIVNRRDSDLTFKTEGVLYTSSGRDIEMSVASTKAFYAQITAGAILGLHLSLLLKASSPEFVSEQMAILTRLPDYMKTILNMKTEIKASADRLAVTKNYWATVGSGANKTSADEIRIKLSELCYKTISSDFVEDKKHIDLSSEPLIIVCAAGTRESVLGDIIKDTAIFHAHKACPIVITTENEDRFDLYAEDVFKVPEMPEHFSPILNTLVGHLWGYYAALAINAGSKFMFEAKNEVLEIMDEYGRKGHNSYEVLLEKRFMEKMAEIYNRFSKKRQSKEFPAAMGLDTIANLTLIFKYLCGRLPVSDFEIDFGIKGTPANLLDAYFENISQAVNTLARPVDAIKHQAKTVTVGTSRISEGFKGVLFDALEDHDISVAQLTNQNVLVIKNLQEVIARVKGALLYQVNGLNLLGETTEDTTIRVVSKTGALKDAVSRVESDSRLKGTKNIIVREGNVYIGTGRKDNRSILVIPVLSSSPSSPNVIEYIFSLHVAFKSSNQVSLLKKIKALGGKYTRIKDWVLERENVSWDDSYLNLVSIGTLFGSTAEQAVEAILREMDCQENYKDIA